MKILVREVGRADFIWESKEMNREEIIETLQVLLKPSMFGNKNFDILVKYH